ncbi:hypothetical protein ACFPRL_29750 [Pseudoclavibacter helvolus]
MSPASYRTAPPRGTRENITSGLGVVQLGALNPRKPRRVGGIRGPQTDARSGLPATKTARIHPNSFPSALRHSYPGRVASPRGSNCAPPNSSSPQKAVAKCCWVTPEQQIPTIFVPETPTGAAL